MRGMILWAAQQPLFMALPLTMIGAPAMAQNAERASQPGQSDPLARDNGTNFGLAAAEAEPAAHGAATLVNVSASGAAHSAAIKPSEMQTGQPMILKGVSGPMQFAGKDIVLDGFDGVLGYATEIGYVVVIEGTAQLGDQVAKRGRMLLLRPFGTAPEIAAYDAKRLHQGLKKQGVLPASMDEALGKLAQRQSTGIFFGRLSPTQFNVAASGSARAEQNKRPTIGGRSIRNLRFSIDGSDPAGAEAKIISSFASALAAQDAEMVAELLDPQPYGLGEGSTGASDGRRALAAALVQSRDWAQQFTSVAPQYVREESAWAVPMQGGRMLVSLRSTRDFPFISDFKVESE